MVLLEATWPERWEPLLLAADYLFAAYDGLNRYYVRAEDRQLLLPFKDPVCYYDDYIRHDHQRIIDEMREQLLPLNELGPTAIAVARGCMVCLPDFRGSGQRCGMFYGVVREKRNP